MEKLLEHLKLDYCIKSKTETTLSTFLLDLEMASEHGFLRNVRAIKEKYDLFFCYEEIYEEKILGKDIISKDDMLKKCGDVVTTNMLSEEVERIYCPSVDGSFGVPTHYLLDIMDSSTCDETINILVKSMHCNGRLIRDKYGIIDISAMNVFSAISHRDAYKMYQLNKGGVVVIKSPYQISDGNKYSENQDNIYAIAQTIKEFSTTTTTILCSTTKDKG
ncbi:MAG: hypothetical protein IJ358_00785 [Clostridia bacterium]|nr:hypothetical protein [Clostridia bacterium]